MNKAYLTNAEPTFRPGDIFRHAHDGLFILAYSEDHWFPVALNTGEIACVSPSAREAIDAAELIYVGSNLKIAVSP